MIEVLQGFSCALENDIKQNKEARLPEWYTNDLKTLRQPCQLTHIIECDPEFRDSYRNKVEFTIGRRY